jgi:hypothetical protein
LSGWINQLTGEAFYGVFIGLDVSLAKTAVCVYLNAYASVAEAKAGIGTWHQSLGYRTPRQVYEEGLWICGRSASPPGCASPASSESGEMLAFAHIPTGATANTGFESSNQPSR